MRIYAGCEAGKSHLRYPGRRGTPQLAAALGRLLPLADGSTQAAPEPEQPPRWQNGGLHAAVQATAADGGRDASGAILPGAWILVSLAVLGPIMPVQAATLQVGPGAPYAQPSTAIAAAHDGDTVLIAPGTYFDCAIVGRNDLTIAGSGPGATVLTDKPCAGKASLVVNGHDVTVRNLTLTRIRVPDGNGAGIRAEGGNLTVDHVDFVNNQDGILAASQPAATLIVRDSTFSQNGVCDPGCGHGIDAGRLKLLRIEHSIFQQARGGDHIRSLAQTTELLGNRLEDSGGHMTGPLVFLNDSNLTLQDNTVTAAPGAAKRPGMVLAVGEVSTLVVRGNSLHEAAGQDVPLLRNWTGQTAEAEGNTVPPGSAAVSDAGSAYHRLRARLGALRDALHALAGKARHVVAVVLHRVI
jgi:hypothetical protein